MGFSIRLFYLILVFTIFFAGLLIATNPAPMASLQLLFAQPSSRQTIVIEQIKAPSVY